MRTADGNWSGHCQLMTSKYVCIAGNLLQCVEIQCQEETSQGFARCIFVITVRFTTLQTYKRVKAKAIFTHCMKLKSHFEGHIQNICKTKKLRNVHCTIIRISFSYFLLTEIDKIKTVYYFLICNLHLIQISK